MSKLNLSNFAKNISAKLGANAPGITIGLGTGAILVAGVMVGVATPKAMKLIEDAQAAKTKRFEKMKEKAPDDAVMDETDELTWVEIIKAGWKPYAPAIMTAVVGVACIVGGTRANARRNAALSAAYVRCFGYDPYNAKEFVERWATENGSFGVEKVIQGARTESVPLGELKKLAEERILYFDEELMKFAMGNCIIIEDTNGNRKLSKKRYDQKIDAVAAMMDAYVAYKLNIDAFE